jgi:hypothetical protein
MKRKLFLKSNLIHNYLGWVGVICLFVWCITALGHALGAWYVPQPVHRQPPPQHINLEGAQPLQVLLQGKGIREATILKAVGILGGTYLQATVSQSMPRRYIEVRSGKEVKDLDAIYAEGLARYYMGWEKTPVKSVSFQSEFSKAYSSVNRLLPVYRVSFDTFDRADVYIYTETASLARVYNAAKAVESTLFRLFHNWSWMPDGRVAEFFRVLMIFLFSASLMALILTGTLLVFLIKRKARKGRRLHRAIGYFVLLPLFGFTASGLYHLLYHAGATDEAVMRMPPAMNLTHLPGNSFWPEPERGSEVTSVSINRSKDETYFFRLQTAQARSAGMAPGGNRPKLRTTYLDMQSLQPMDLTDKARAKELALSFSSSDDSNMEIAGIEMVNHFGLEYNFRNKRLPVWKVMFADEAGSMVFIDPATSALVDRTRSSALTERWVFRHLHMWHFLDIIGRKSRSILLSLALIASMTMGYYGIRLLLIGRQKKQRMRQIAAKRDTRTHEQAI